MKRFLRTLPSALLAMAVSAAARSDQGGPGARGAWGYGSLHRIEKCLATLDLPAATRSDLDAALANGRATLKADGEAMKAAHSQMEADLANVADKATLGQDALNLDAAKQKMKLDSQTLHDQILAQLSPDQQDAVRACASAHDGHGRGAGSGPQTQPQ